MSKVLQDKNLNLKERTVTFTARTIQINSVIFFLLVCFFLLCCSLLCFVTLTSQGTSMLFIVPFVKLCIYQHEFSQTSFTIEQYMESAALWDLYHRYVHYTLQIKELIESHNLIYQFNVRQNSNICQKVHFACLDLIYKSKG